MGALGSSGGAKPQAAGSHAIAIVSATNITRSVLRRKRAGVGATTAWFLSMCVGVASRAEAGRVKFPTLFGRRQPPQ